MNPAPYPLVFEPQLVAKPWGGRRLEQFGKRLPPGERIGESWELSGLPQRPTAVREGPLAGRTLAELTELWADPAPARKDGTVRGGAVARGQASTTGTVQGPSSEFPLLVKLLDAQDWLSVQVHPRPGSPAAKHEFWYICAAAPGARLLAGLCPGVTRAEYERAAGTRAVVDLLQSWPVRAGDAIWLPSGTPHALGAGVVVAEVQQPGDVTYRLYDWDRADTDGRRRTLDLARALAATTCEPCPGPVQPGAGPIPPPRALAEPPFTIVLRRPGRATMELAGGELCVWIVTAGQVELTWDGGRATYGIGTTVLLLPSLLARAAFSDAELIEVGATTAPRPSAAPDRAPRPRSEA